jgi:transposase-like protein
MGRRKDAALQAAWRGRCERFDRAGLTVTEFCRREGVSQARFYQWRKRLAQEASRSAGRISRRPAAAAGPGPDPAAFVEVSWRPASVVEIELPNGVLVRVPADGEAVLVTTLRTVGNLGCPEQHTQREAATC